MVIDTGTGTETIYSTTTSSTGTSTFSSHDYIHTAITCPTCLVTEIVPWVDWEKIYCRKCNTTMVRNK